MNQGLRIKIQEKKTRNNDMQSKQNKSAAASSSEKKLPLKKFSKISS